MSESVRCKLSNASVSLQTTVDLSGGIPLILFIQSGFCIPTENRDIDIRSIIREPVILRYSGMRSGSYDKMRHMTPISAASVIRISSVFGFDLLQQDDRSVRSRMGDSSVFEGNREVGMAQCLQVTHAAADLAEFEIICPGSFMVF